MSTLHNTINSLASQFAHDLLRALRGASLDEIVHETSPGHVRRPDRPRAQFADGGGGEVPAPFLRGKRGKRSKRLARRSPEDLKKMVDKLVAIVKGAKKGISAEGIKAALKIERRELPRPLAMALKSKKIQKRGQKRATVYFAGGGAQAAGKAKPVAKKRRAKRSTAKKGAAKRPTAKRSKRASASKPKAVAGAPAAPSAAA